MGDTEGERDTAAQDSEQGGGKSRPKVWWQHPGAVALLVAVVGAMAPISVAIGGVVGVVQETARARTAEVLSLQQFRHDAEIAYVRAATNGDTPADERERILRFLQCHGGEGCLAEWAKSEEELILKKKQELSERMEAAQILEYERGRAESKAAEEEIERKLAALQARVLSLNKELRATNVEHYSYEDLDADPRFVHTAPVDLSPRATRGFAAVKADEICRALGNAGHAAYQLRDDGRAIHSVTCAVR